MADKPTSMRSNELRLDRLASYGLVLARLIIEYLWYVRPVGLKNAAYIWLPT
jgi:hypothetical protein